MSSIDNTPKRDPLGQIHIDFNSEAFRAFSDFVDHSLKDMLRNNDCSVYIKEATCRIGVILQQIKSEGANARLQPLLTLAKEESHPVVKKKVLNSLTTQIPAVTADADGVMSFLLECLKSDDTGLKDNALESCLELQQKFNLDAAVLLEAASNARETSE